MAKGVLGNDPFQRGAAARPTSAERPEAATPTPPPPAASSSAKAAAPKGKAAAKGKAPSPSSRRGKAETSAAAKGETASARKEAAPGTTGPRATARQGDADRTAGTRTSTARSAPVVAGAVAPAAPAAASPVAVATAATVSARGERPVPHSKAPEPTPGSSSQRRSSDEPPAVSHTPPAAPEPARPATGRAAMGELLDRTLRSRVSPLQTAPEDHPTTAHVEPLVPGTYVPHPSSPDAVEILTPAVEEQPAPKPPAGPASESRAARAVVDAPRFARELVRVVDTAGPAESAALEGAPASGAMAFVRSLFGQALQSEGLHLARQVLGGSYRALLTGLGTGGSLTLDDYGKDAELTERLSPLADLLFDRYWRVAIQGASLIPRGPAILVANHSGAIPVDGPVLHHALARERGDLAESRWLVEDQIFHAPFLGVLLNRLGAVRANPDNALRLLEEGRPVIVFPEGIQGIGKPFRERYQLKRFGRGGFVKLARRSGAPIVPVAIVGAEETAPLLGKLPGRFLGLPYVPVTSPIPLPARWSIRFGEPIDVRDTTDDLADVQRVTERTREAIQGMLQTLLRERGPAFATGSARGGPEVRA